MSKINSKDNSIKTIKHKIYCKKCKYYKPEVYGEFEGFFPSECRKTFEYEHDYKSFRKIYGNPKIINKNNDCSDFELKWWRKLLILERM